MGPVRSNPGMTHTSFLSIGFSSPHSTTPVSSRTRPHSREDLTVQIAGKNIVCLSHEAPDRSDVSSAGRALASRYLSHIAQVVPSRTKAMGFILIPLLARCLGQIANGRSIDRGVKGRCILQSWRGSKGCKMKANQIEYLP